MGEFGEYKFTELQYAKPIKGEPKKLYLYDDEGFHHGAIWFTSGVIHDPVEEIPAEIAVAFARLHLKSNLEVRITDGGDMLLFHSQHGKVLYPQNCKLEEFWSTL